MSSRPAYPQPPTSPETSHIHDIFFDPTGRRWRLVKVGILLFMALVVVLVTVSWQPVQQPPSLEGNNARLPVFNAPDEGRTPVIGVGPLVRFVRVERHSNMLFAVDPLTNQRLNTIAGNDADTVGAAGYAIQHYGYSSAAHKTIELTFDDGPDPTWTPKILNLLSKHKVPATFFVVGSEVVKYPNIVSRAVREGHAVGNHTLTHPDLTPDQVEQEFGFTDRIIRATTGNATNLVRLPYDGAAGRAADAQTNEVMINAARLHYIVSTEEFDTNDWKYGDPATRPKKPIPLPPLAADNLTILLHDGGGNRSATLAYLERLIPWAKAHGYSFHSLPQVSPQVVDGTSHVAPSLWDRETLWLYQALWSWPNTLITLLFVLAIISVVIGGVVNVVLAVGRRARYRRRFIQREGDTTGPPVSIAVAAYNEEKVIGRTLDALCHSRYPHIREIIVVDDGSSDSTVDIVSEMATKDHRIRLLRQENMGKATALNRAFFHAQADVVVTLDADTVFAPTTTGNLVRHFALDTEERLGAVAGVVKVGNLGNLITRWQALDYVNQIGVDRGAQDALHAIMVVPGACAAWRKEAVLHVGGYSRSTLAEDCDLALQLQRVGYLVTQDDEATCYTEAPETVGALVRQRFRWMYGNIQAMWKHRGMILNPRYGWLGMLTLPLAAISVVMPVVFLPFVYAMALVTFKGQGLALVLLYVAVFLLVQFFTAAIGIWLTNERPAHLLMVPFYRLFYEPLRAYILYKSALTVLRGTRSSWNKLQRTGTVNAAPSDSVEGTA
jgi:biofilm PGA synthesis N-glycosyltransferase PgaC